MKFIFSIFLFFAFSISPLISGDNESFNRARNFDVQHYLVRLDFDRNKKIVFSESTITLKPLSKNLNSLELDAKNLKFEYVKLASSGKKLRYIKKNEKLTIILDKSYNQNDVISIDTKYSVRKPKKGIYFVDAIKKRGKIIQRSQIWTQGETEETSYWLPSFDSPDDKATTEQFITVEKGETAIANGELLETLDNKNGTVTYHYKMKVPHSLYLTSFVVGTYEKITEKYRDIPLSYYVYPGQKSLVKKAFGKTIDMFRIFENLTQVKYPYNKYDQTIVADFKFGGMENITATTLADSEVMLAKFKFGRGLVEDLVSHELAHSWFGNLVTCRNWAELWLNESFATFMEAAYREKMYGVKDYNRKISADADEYFLYSAVSDGNQHSLFNRTADAKNDDTMFTAITYQKGSVVIHMLRREIGEEAFWNGVNSYLTKHKFKNVETEDLQKEMELASGKDLTWFFKQWIYGNTYPALKVNQTYNRKSKELILQITQTQKGNQFTPNAFVLPLEVEISMSKKKTIKKILLNKRTQEFRIPVDEKPYNLVIDKENKIPLKDVNLSRLRIVR